MIYNLEHYKVFYYVAKNGSITVAAQELAISQPAVSQSIRQLETSLGTMLFKRTSKGVRLSKEGELLFSYVTKGYEQIELGEYKLKQMLNLEIGEIRIGASDMTLQFFLLPFLELFHEQYPGIKVKVTNAPTPLALQHLREGAIDFGVVSTPFETNPDMDVLLVKEIEDSFVAGRKFIQYKNRMLDLSELSRLPLICLERNTSTRSFMDAFLEKQGVQIQPEFELATSDMVVQFAMKNLGIGSVMKEFAKKQLESGQLFELRFNKKIPRRNFCIVTDHKNQKSIAANNLLQLINKEQTEGKERLL